MKIKCAVYVTEYGNHSIIKKDAEAETWCGYVRLTEFVEVDFPELPVADVVQNQVVAIDAQIEEIKSEAMKKVSGLNQRKQELLALTVQS